MKRSGPLRRTPLKRTGSLKRTQAMTSHPTARRRSEGATGRSGIPEAVRHEVMMRDGRCVAPRLVPEVLCWGESDPHHVKRKSQGGEDTTKNLIALCRAHHDWVHAHPDRSVSLGLLKRAWQ
jgi:hypothetical protein